MVYEKLQQIVNYKSWHHTTDDPQIPTAPHQKTQERDCSVCLSKKFPFSDIYLKKALIEQTERVPFVRSELDKKWVYVEMQI